MVTAGQDPVSGLVQVGYRTTVVAEQAQRDLVLALEPLDLRIGQPHPITVEPRRIATPLGLLRFREPDPQGQEFVGT